MPMRPFEAFNNNFGTSNKSAYDSNLRITKFLDHSRQGAIALNFSNIELAKQRAAFIKWKVSENLDKYLVAFEASVLRKGGKVLWAHDAENALHEIEQIFKKGNQGKILNSGSNLSAEIGLANFMKSKQLNYIDTSITSYFLELLEKQPFHPSLPAAKLVRTDLLSRLNKSIKTSLEAGNEELLSDVRDELRRKFYEAEFGIVEADFILADAGMVVISENEGDARLGLTFSKTNIILASIDKILPSFSDLELFLPLLSTHKNGQFLAAYSNIFGPPLREESEVSSEFIVILIDNGRSDTIASQEQRQALSCIGCGACYNICPVFSNVEGMLAYQGSYGGPIGQVLNPLQKGLEQFKHLSFASTLCGKCTSVCPVNIDIHNHLLRNRHESIKQNLEKTGDKFAWYTWKKLMLSRKNINKPNAFKSFTLKQLFKNDWGEREFPKLADKSFNQLWREKAGLK